MTRASRYRWLYSALESGRHELSGEIAIGAGELPMPILAFANLPGGAPTVHNDGIPLRGVSVNRDKPRSGPKEARRGAGLPSLVAIMMVAGNVLRATPCGSL
jgi:hypothetical protein